MQQVPISQKSDTSHRLSQTSNLTRLFNQLPRTSDQKRADSKSSQSKRTIANIPAPWNACVLKDLKPTVESQLKNKLSKLEHDAGKKLELLKRLQEEKELVRKNRSTNFTLLHQDTIKSQYFSVMSNKSIQFRTVDNSIHKGYEQYLNSESLEQLEEKREFLYVKLQQLEDMTVEETCYSLSLETAQKRLHTQKLYDYQKHQHTMPEFKRLVRMNDSVKQASFLNQTSLITKVSGFQRCKESLIDTKLKNQEKVKMKQSEFQFQETEVKAMKQLVTSKSNKYQDAKRKLNELKRLNKMINIEDMKSQLFQIRKHEMKQLIQHQLLAALFKYFLHSRSQTVDLENTFDKEQVKNMNLFELRIALDTFKQDIEDYDTNYTIDQLSPEITIIVQQRYQRLIETVTVDQKTLDGLAEFIEESTIYNQSLQLKCNELTTEISKRKASVYQLKNALSDKQNQRIIELKHIKELQQQQQSNSQLMPVEQAKSTKTSIIMLEEAINSLKELESRPQKKKISYQDQFKNQSLMALESQKQNKISETYHQKVFLRQFYHSINEMVLKMSAKLLKIREVVPSFLREQHFPMELMMMLGTYQKMNSRKKHKSSVEDLNNYVSNTARSLAKAQGSSAGHSSSAGDDNAAADKGLEEDDPMLILNENGVRGQEDEMEDDDEDSESPENSFEKKQYQEIKNLQKAANELKKIKKAKQQENQLLLKKNAEESEMALMKQKLSDKKIMFQEIWMKLQEQEKLLNTPLDTANTLKLSLQRAIKKMIEGFKHTLNLKMLICQLDLNKAHIQEELKDEDQMVKDFEMDMAYFKKNYKDCYQKLNLEQRQVKRGKQTKARAITELGENQDYNENSFLEHQYEKEKAEFQKRLKEKLYGKRKKKSKISLKERRKIRFFNNLNKRGINADRDSQHKTNLKYTQVQKQISNYHKSENRFINSIVREFEDANKKISTVGQGGVYIPKKFSQKSMSASPDHNQKQPKDDSKQKANDNPVVSFNSAITLQNINNQSKRSMTQYYPYQKNSSSDLKAFETFKEKRDSFDNGEQKIPNPSGLKLRSIQSQQSLQLGSFKSQLPSIQVPGTGDKGGASHTRGLSEIKEVPNKPGTTKANSTRNPSLFKTSQTQANWFTNNSHKRVFNMKTSFKQHQPALNTEPSISEYKPMGNSKISLLDTNWKRKKQNSEIDSATYVSTTKISPTNKESMIIRNSESKDQLRLTSPAKEMITSNSEMKFDIISKIYENDKMIKSKTRPKIFL